MEKRRFFFLFLAITRSALGFSVAPASRKVSDRRETSLQAHDSEEPSSRRQMLQTAASAILLGFSASQPADAAEEQKATIWLTGKPPKVPGQKPKDKSDVPGTRKDPKFLRSIADCKNQCENSAGPDGYARTKEECLSDCQDICCQTYEQVRPFQSSESVKRRYLCIVFAHCFLFSIIISLYKSVPSLSFPGYNIAC